MASRNLLASRGVPVSATAMAGAWDELEHRAKVGALIDGLASGGKRKR